MEVRVYRNSADWNGRKSVLIQRLSSNDSILFPYDSCIRTFKSLYGSECIVEFVIL